MGRNVNEPGDEDDVEVHHQSRRPITGADTRGAVERMARIRHLTDQSTAASRALGELVGAFAQGAAAHGSSEELVMDLTHHYLDLLLPPEA